MEALAEKTGGRVKYDYYGQGTLVKARDMFDATARGTADIGNMVYAGSKVPLMYFQQLPGVYSDEESVRSARAFWKVSQKYVAPIFEKNNLKLLYGFTTSGYQIMTTGAAVRKIDDLKGMKLRATGSVPAQQRQGPGRGAGEHAGQLGLRGPGAEGFWTASPWPCPASRATPSTS